MDSYDSATVYSSIDHGGRYAYRNQPAIAHWNLACLAQTLMPLFADDQFEVSGDEEFIAHLKISNGRCSFHDGPVKNPAIVVKTPAEVWLAISRGERDGQQAFMNGEYKAEGDIGLLLKLKTLFAQI